eukprot:COSAG01_NODE_11120_length_2002_cov_9.305307_2_plen_111_part_00
MLRSGSHSAWTNGSTRCTTRVDNLLVLPCKTTPREKVCAKEQTTYGLCWQVPRKLDTFFARAIVSWEKVVATKSVYVNTEHRYNVVLVLQSPACPHHARHLTAYDDVVLT